MNIIVYCFCGVDIYAAKIAIITTKRLTNRHNRLTNDHSLVVFCLNSLGVMPVKALKVRKKDPSVEKPDCIQTSDILMSG